MLNASRTPSKSSSSWTGAGSGGNWTEKQAVEKKEEKGLEKKGQQAEKQSRQADPSSLQRITERKEQQAEQLMWEQGAVKSVGRGAGSMQRSREQAEQQEKAGEQAADRGAVGSEQRSLSSDSDERKQR